MISITNTPAAAAIEAAVLALGERDLEELDAFRTVRDLAPQARIGLHRVHAHSNRTDPKGMRCEGVIEYVVDYGTHVVDMDLDFVAWGIPSRGIVEISCLTVDVGQLAMAA